MKYILSFFSLVFFINLLMGQSNNNSYRIYGTQQVQQRLLQENVNMASQQAAIEQFIANYNEEGQVGEVTIPIVFHILYKEPEEQITNAQVLSQIDALNNSFNVSLMNEGERHPADLAEDFEQHTPDNIGIQFCLARILNGGRPINFIPTTTSAWGTDDAMKKPNSGGAAPIEPENYLNIWVCNLGNTSSGYAQMPGGPTLTDGIVIDYRFFGTIGTATAPYDLGKTLTHLVGSYLGLYELWDEFNLCGDDYVTDTPIHNAPNNGPANYYRHVSLCADGEVEMSMNFMDNSDDATLYMFTVGQLLRMEANLTVGGARHQLTSSNTMCLGGNLEETPPNFSKQETPETKNLTIFPSPANHTVQIKVPEIVGEFSMVIYNSVGKIIHWENSKTTQIGQSIELDVKGWESGLYFVHAKLGKENKNYRFMVVK